MKITHMQEVSAVTRLRVEGWITQQTVQELSASCEPVLTEQRSLLLDLSGADWPYSERHRVYIRATVRGSFRV